MQGVLRASEHHAEEKKERKEEEEEEEGERQNRFSFARQRCRVVPTLFFK